MHNHWIVFMRAGALGDFLLSMPLLRELSRGPARLCLITRRKYLEVLPPGCRSDRFLDIDGPGISSLFAESAALPPDLVQVLRDAHVYLFCGRDEALETNLQAAGVARITHLDSRPETPPHVAVRFFKDAGLPVPDQLLETPLWPRIATGDALWVHPGSGGRVKNCAPEVFAEFAKTWQVRHAKPVLVSFGEADLHLEKPIADAFAAAAVEWDAVHPATLKELHDGLAVQAAEYIGNDSGVTHLAAMLGIPVTAYYRSTDPEIWRPLGNCRCVQST